MTPTQLISNERIKEFIALHQQWQLQPITRQLLLLLDKEKDKLVTFIMNSSTNKEISDQQIRLWSAQIQKIEQNKRLINDTKYFIEQIPTQS